ncbi:MAG TPA: hypothetical protein VM324_00490 [Egibacteraceae bacterium]|nr:hypothetical protein [Egibacteraceae bacterium]
MRTFALLLLAGLVLVACADAPDVGAGAAPPERPADIAGTVTAVTPAPRPAEGCLPADPEADPAGTVSSDDPPVCPAPDSDQLGTALVEAEPDTDTGDKAVVFIGTSTALLRAAADGLEPITFDDLREGLAVEVWFDGPVAESYPVQAGGAALIVRAEQADG